MNFLLHRHLAREELGSPLSAVGAMLPDLWRLADRRMRARKGVEVDARPALRELQQGVHHHLQADRWFHQTSVFLSGERATAEALRREGGDAKKLGLFAHISWEMCLDGALVLRQGPNEAVASLRADLQKAQTADTRELADAHGAARVIGDRRRFERRMADMHRGLHRGGWILGYCQPSGLVTRLSGMRARFGFEPFSDRQRTSLEVAFAERLGHARRAVEELLHARRGSA